MLRIATKRGLFSLLTPLAHDANAQIHANNTNSLKRTSTNNCKFLHIAKRTGKAKANPYLRNFREDFKMPSGSHNTFSVFQRKNCMVRFWYNGYLTKNEIFELK